MSALLTFSGRWPTWTQQRPWSPSTEPARTIWFARTHWSQALWGWKMEIRFSLLRSASTTVRPHIFWEDEIGVIQYILQLAKREQDDSLMSMLFLLGQHSVRMTSQERLTGEERLMTFLDDVYVVCGSDWNGIVFFNAEHELRTRVHNQSRHDETQVWIRGGLMSGGIEELTRTVRMTKSDEVVWSCLSLLLLLDDPGSNHSKGYWEREVEK